MSEITYILGAGASCQAMPLVKNFALRFEVFLDYVMRSTSPSNKLSIDAKEFLIKVKTHFSFDTFFKKLFHQGADTSANTYKQILLLYFLFEHLMDLDRYRQFSQGRVEKMYNIDPRYDAMIAGLLKPIRNKTEFYSKINFITWNYDMNLLAGLNSFMSPDLSFFDFLKANNNNGIFKLGNQISVHHMNGLIYHDALQHISGGANLDAEFLELISQYNRGHTELANYAQSIRFAWENDESNFQHLKGLIVESNYVIIIGYSLPLYNRKTDLIYLNPAYFASEKNLIVQDTRADEIINILNSDFTLKNRKVNGKLIFDIQAVTNCDSFFVPRKILT